MFFRGEAALTWGPRKAKGEVFVSRRACPCPFVIKTEIQFQWLAISAASSFCSVDSDSRNREVFIS